jgi:hypothetical protein
MIGVKPPAGFERLPLDIETIPSGRRFGRIYASGFPDPLGFGKTASRFSDPRRRDATKRFGVLYLGETLKVCFLEAVLRDRRMVLSATFRLKKKRSTTMPAMRRKYLTPCHQPNQACQYRSNTSLLGKIHAALTAASLRVATRSSG